MSEVEKPTEEVEQPKQEPAKQTAEDGKQEEPAKERMGQPTPES